MLLGIITFSLMGLAITLVCASVFINPEGEDTDSSLEAVMAASSVLPSVLYMCYIYGSAWRFGAKDINLVKYGHITPRPLAGLRCGLWVSLVSAAFILAALVFPVSRAYELTHFIYYWFFALTGRRVYLYFLVLPAVPLCAHWGYCFGYKYISIRQKLMYVDPHAQSERKRAKDKRIR
jgi:hypothetical protein